MAGVSTPSLRFGDGIAVGFHDGIRELAAAQTIPPDVETPRSNSAQFFGSAFWWKSGEDRFVGIPTADGADWPGQVTIG